MSTRKHKKGSRRGFSLVEVITASGILLSLVSVMGLLAQVQSRMWIRAEARLDVKQTLAQAVGRMEPTIQSAMRVDTSASSAQTLTVIMPGSFDTTTGKLQEGDVVRFYLSNAGGTPGSQGSLLWRSVNGVPDRAWTYRGGSATDLGAAGLGFSYPSTGTNAVTVTATAKRLAGPQGMSHSFSTTLYLRNSRS